ncbi:Hpt domain-containing protein [Paenirhodobacter sp. CAU 1674]|uniref:Hpt domain-containing protein n=1 Tax=Paenirhodobacter sp. CAU 1674 TaxID=3032596 RepID=UPI0023D9EC91|nr:Hpt domain-containing protein [Paenirhodobacter sp. CAU 1674]MDF2142661.1 Hpt domain-containing protein [Paenirhodobacter sp. CAU 1674]
MGEIDTRMVMPEALVQALADVKKQFMSRLVPSILEIEALQSELRDPLKAPAALERLSFIVHKLHGLAMTVGFAELGRCAADLDLRLRAILSELENSALQVGLAEALEDLMDQMEDAVLA